MTTARDGNTVAVHYTGTLGDGTQFDSSAGRDPLEFALGEGTVIAGFEEATRGMSIGERKTVVIACQDAYGPHQPELVQAVERDQLPPDLDLRLGTRLQTSGPQATVVRVTEVTETTVTLDANHPLAGEDLTFEIQLVEIR